MEMEVDLLPKKFYETIINICRTEPEKKEELKESFITCLDHILTNLIIEQKFDQVFEVFREVFEVFGSQEPNILNCLAVALNKLDKPLEALNYLDKAIRLCPKKLILLENRENIINQWVPRWHFIMLNDCDRNIAYKKSIYKIISEQKCNSVLDIGTGTGLLSEYCADAGAKNVFACEMDEIMLSIAEKVFEINEKPIKLLAKHSTKIVLNSDINITGFDLIVTEIFDSGAFGEEALSTMIHAKKNLLLENGRILPKKISMYVCGVDSIGIAEKLQSIQNTMENSIYLKDTILIPETDSPYEPIEIINSDLSVCTDKQLAFTVDFNDLISLENALEGKLDTEVKLCCLDEGYLEGFLVFFELYLDDEIKLSNFDGDEKDQLRCWDPIIFPLITPLEVRKYQILKPKLSCKNGVLNVAHEHNKPGKRTLTIPQDIFNFLSDDEYILELEFNVNKALQKNKNPNLVVGDFLTFPHIGINLLKEYKITKLFCLSSVRELILKIAEWNCISLDKFEFINDLDEFNLESQKFDLILIQPINTDGLLNQLQLKFYEYLKNNLLKPNGIIFPSKLDICFKLIYSNWLEKVAYVRNDELKSLGIENLINEYSTKHQFEYIDFDTKELSENFIATIQFKDEEFEKTFCINLKTSTDNENSVTHINGILYHYKIYFVNNALAISTNRKKSFCKTNCFVNNFECKTGCVKINYIQNEFIFRCKIVD